MEYKRIPIKDYEGIYDIDIYGNVFSLDRIVDRGAAGEVLIKGKRMKHSKDRYGYMTTHLSKNGTKKWFKVHRLVALAFINGYDELIGRTTVNHIDGDKSNNRMDNLEWMTNKEQSIHSLKTKLRKVMFTDDEVRFIRNWEGRIKDLCDLLGISVSNACNIRSKRKYIHVE